MYRLSRDPVPSVATRISTQGTTALLRRPAEGLPNLNGHIHGIDTGERYG
jgi:hypothetical protein